MRLKNLGASKLALLFVLLFIWSGMLLNKQWKTEYVIANDMNYYYVYLPAAFIYHDLTFSYINDKLPNEVYRSSWTLPTADGKHQFSKMSCGIAMMLTPFFLIAHLYQLIFGDSANGYTQTYALFVCLASFFYIVIGLIYQHKILIHFFDERTTAFTLIALGLGTNIYFYTSYSFSNSHIFSYCLFTIFIWKTIQWHHKPAARNSVIIGLLLGLITIVRPNDIAILLFPLLYGIHNRNSLKEKMNFLRNNGKNLMLIIPSFIIPILPQLILWKIQTGQFIFYSYQDERFYFSHPHILEGFFSFRNGMFIYAPVLLLIIPGFIYAWKKRERFIFAATVFFLINSIVVFSWWCWWYGGSFGIRAMVESYALLALPLGCFIKELGRKKFSNYVLAIFVGLCVLLNQFQTLQAQSSLLHYSDMTFKTYKLIFGRLTQPENYAESLNHPDIDKAFEGKPERDFTTCFPFLKGSKNRNVSLKASNGKFVSSVPYLQSTLIADRTEARSWETFRLSMMDYGRCYLFTWENKYVSIEQGESARLIANGDKAGHWQKFYIEYFPDNKFALKAACNKKYVRVNPENNYILEATSFGISKDNLFEITAQ